MCIHVQLHSSDLLMAPAGTSTLASFFLFYFIISCVYIHFDFSFFSRHSANYVLTIMKRNLYKYTMHHGTYETDQDLHSAGFYLVCWSSFVDWECKLATCVGMFDDVTCVYNLADTSRHYYPVDVIKQIIESMSYAKLVSCVAHCTLSCLDFGLKSYASAVWLLSNHLFLCKPAYNSDVENCIH